LAFFFCVQQKKNQPSDHLELCDLYCCPENQEPVMMSPPLRTCSWAIIVALIAVQLSASVQAGNVLLLAVDSRPEVIYPNLGCTSTAPSPCNPFSGCLTWMGSATSGCKSPFTNPSMCHLMDNYPGGATTSLTTTVSANVLKNTLPPNAG
jgi:hypothetical protein